MNIKFLSYSTTYYYKVNGGEEKIFVNSACFSRAFSGGDSFKPKNNNGYFGVLVRLDESDLDENLNNYCPLTMDEIKEYLQWVTKLTKFKFEIKDNFPSDGVHGKFIVVHSDFENMSHYKIKLALTMVRNLYEMKVLAPVKLAFAMKNTCGFKRLSLSKRYVLANSIMPGFNSGIHECTSFGAKSTITDIDIIKNINDKDVNKVGKSIQLDDSYRGKLEVFRDYEESDQFVDLMKTNTIDKKTLKLLKNNKKIIGL